MRCAMLDINLQVLPQISRHVRISGHFRTNFKISGQRPGLILHLKLWFPQPVKSAFQLFPSSVTKIGRTNRIGTTPVGPIH